MKKLISLAFILSLALFTSCEKSSSSWENVKTAGRYLQMGIDSLWGKKTDSYWVQNEGEFIGPDEDFIPLNEKDLRGSQSLEKIYAQPKDMNEKSVFNLTNFKMPQNLASIFQNIHFDTDDHVVREKEDLITIQKIATYLKKHPKTYLCIEGHCDQRASAAYNMALGTRRANNIRVVLIKQGIDFNRLYTVSYGKEKPISLGNSPQDLKINRRSQFKIFDKL